RYIVHMESLLEEAYLPTVRNSNIIRHIVAPSEFLAVVLFPFN
ncbi:hypothetical protein Tco_0456926, partial [Tanacetum coccineum]